MEGEDGSQLNLAPICLATLRQLTKKSKPRVILASVVLYICFLYLSSMQVVQSMQRGKGLGRSKGRIKAKSTNDSVLLAELGRRRKRVKDTCEKYGAYTTREKVLAKLKLTAQSDFDPGVETDEQLWSLIKKTSHHQFFVQREHGLMWCKVPKAASTSWLHAFLKLANVPDHLIPEDNGMGLHAFLRDKYPLLSKNLNKQFMTKSVKFVVVRHPFERIISAYLDKLHSYARDLKYRGGYYYAMYGADIVNMYRPKYQERFPKNPLFMRKEPSFVEFVEYLVGTPVSKYDEHWKPMFLLCPPCHFKFDVIVKMETFNRDTQFILSQRSLEDEVSLRKKHSSKKSKIARRMQEPCFLSCRSRWCERCMTSIDLTSKCSTTTSRTLSSMPPSLKGSCQMLSRSQKRRRQKKLVKKRRRKLPKPYQQVMKQRKAKRIGCK